MKRAIRTRGLNPLLFQTLRPYVRVFSTYSTIDSTVKSSSTTPTKTKQRNQEPTNNRRRHQRVRVVGNNNRVIMKSRRYWGDFATGAGIGAVLITVILFFPAL